MPPMRRARTCTPVRAALLVLAWMCIAPPVAAQNSQWIIEVQDNRFKGVKGFSKFETMVTVFGAGLAAARHPRDAKPARTKCCD